MGRRTRSRAAVLWLPAERRVEVNAMKELLDLAQEASLAMSVLVQWRARRLGGLTTLQMEELS